MLKKSLFAIALVVPALTLSAPTLAQTYQGGPKSATVRSVPPQAKKFEPNKPYAQAPEEQKGKHVYQGGPKSNIPHASH